MLLVCIAIVVYTHRTNIKLLYSNNFYKMLISFNNFRLLDLENKLVEFEKVLNQFARHNEI